MILITKQGDYLESLFYTVMTFVASGAAMYHGQVFGLDAIAATSYWNQMILVLGLYFALLMQGLWYWSDWHNVNVSTMVQIRSLKIARGCMLPVLTFFAIANIVAAGDHSLQYVGYAAILWCIALALREIRFDWRMYPRD